MGSQIRVGKCRSIDSRYTVTSRHLDIKATCRIWRVVVTPVWFYREDTEWAGRGLSCTGNTSIIQVLVNHIKNNESLHNWSWCLLNFHPITCHCIVSLQFLATSTKDGMSTQSFIYVAYVTEIYWKNEFLQYTLLVGLNTVLLVTTLLIKIYYTYLVFHIWNSNRSQKAQNNAKAKIHFPANTSSKHHVINYNLS